MTDEFFPAATAAGDRGACEPQADAPEESSPGYGPPEPAGAEPVAVATTYESAAARLEAIIRRLDSGEAGLRETLELCREGRELVEFCARELEAVGAGLEELRLDELVTRLAA